MPRFVALFLLLATPAFAQLPQRNDLSVVDGTVETVVPHGNTLYLGGTFTRVAPPTGGLVAVDPSTGAPTLPPLSLDGSVYAIVADGSGGIYVGGSFQHVQGQVRANVARIAADGTVHPWNANAHGTVRAITRIGATVYLGGDFDQVGGLGRSRLAAVDTTSGALLGWNPGANSTVYALQAQNGLLYVGGIFTTIAGTGRNRICALDPVTATATAWNPNCNGNVYAMFIRYDALALTLTAYVGGQFTVIGGQSRTNLATVDATVGAPTFSQASAFAPAPNGAVFSMRVIGNTIPVLYVGGAFTTIAGQPRNRVASFNGGTLNAWNPDASSTVYGVHLSGSTIYLGGDFGLLGGLARTRAGAVNSSGTAVTNAWDPQPWGPPQVFATSGANLWMGGQFVALAGAVRKNLAALDLSSGQATPWNPGADGTVHDMEWVGDNLYVAGDFLQVGGQLHGSVARFDGAGGLSPWDPGVLGGSVRVLASRPLDATTSLLYLGGTFTVIGDSTRTGLGAVSTATPPVITNWAPVATGPGLVLSLEVEDSYVYVGGHFDHLGPHAVSNLGRVDFAGAGDTWTPVVPTVKDLAFSGNQVYAAYADPSHFSGGVRALSKISNVSAWNALSTGYANTVHVGSSGIEIGGYFDDLEGVAQPSLGRLDIQTGDKDAWDPEIRSVNPTPEVFDLVASNGLLFVAGEFSAIAGRSRSGIAAFYDGIVAVPTSPASAPVALRAAPNPASSSQLLRFELAAPGQARVAIHDVAGRVVRVLVNGALPAGTQSLAWDGRGESGAPVAPGIYFAQLEAGSVRATTKLIRVLR